MPDPLKAKHVTLVGGVVTTVTLGHWFEEVEIINRDGAAEVFFVVGDSGVADPVALADNTDMLPAAVGGVFVGHTSSDAPTVKLISAGAPKVSVIGR